MERTLVLVKPDGVQRGLIGEVISRLERRGLKLVGMKLMLVDDSLARQHYGEHVDRPFFSGLVEFITSGPVVAMAWEAENSVEAVRSTNEKRDRHERELVEAGEQSFDDDDERCVSL